MQECDYDSDNSCCSSIVAPSYEFIGEASDHDEEEWSDVDVVEDFNDDEDDECENPQYETETTEVQEMVIAEEVPCTSTVENSNGYVIVGDNIDKNVRPSFQRTDRKTESWHCFHSYAVYNRVNISKLSDSMPSGEVSVTSVLPNKQDLQRIFEDFEVLISRYLWCPRTVFYYFYIHI